METRPEKIALVCVGCAEPTHTFFAQKDGHDLYRCVSCQMFVVHPLPVSTDEVYGEDYFFGAEDGFGYVDYDGDKEAMRSSFENALDEVERILLEDKSHADQKTLLDIGAATGFFMDIAEKRGWQTRGIELGDAAAQVARDRGFVVDTGTLSTTAIPENSYDAVTLFDVIEHVSDPVGDLEKVAAALRPRGLILINTPDSGSFYAKLMGKNWHLIVPPEHLFYFNKKSMQLALEKTGFEIVRFGHLPKRFTLSYIMNTAGRWLSLPFLATWAAQVKKSTWMDIALPLDFHDNLFVIARKK